MCIILFMALFMIKKWFFNYWDNLFRMFFLNLGYIISITASLGLAYVVNISPILVILKTLLISVIVIFFFSIYNGAVHGMTRDIADYKSPGFKDFFRHIKNSFRVSMLFAAIFSALIFIFFLSFDIYGQIDIFFKNIARSFILGAVFIVITASQYFFPIYFCLDKRFTKIIKKMFLIFFDNPLFSFALLFLSVLLIVLSFFSVLIIPGLSSIPLLLNVGLKLRLYKYDYLEEHPNSNSKIPWDSLLIEDREKVGKRTLKGMIFPWKE